MQELFFLPNLLHPKLSKNTLPEDVQHVVGHILLTIQVTFQNPPPATVHYPPQQQLSQFFP